MKPKKIAVFTGNRAEYGLQYPLLKALNEHSQLEYQLIVSGAHLDKNFGQTLNEIEGDGFKISARVDIELGENSSNYTTNGIGNGIIKISESLEALKPDVLVVYADRFEGFAAVIAASQMSIITAHIEGGDITEGGALDDSVRHAMTKLSHIHFTTNEEATHNVLAMGEEHWRVHTVGFPSIDLIENNVYANENEIIDRFKLELDRPIVLFTQHSVTTEFEKSETQINASLNAIKKLSNNGFQCILTYPNNDVGSKVIIEKIEALKEQRNPNIQVHKSLGRYFYHGILALAKVEKYKIVCVGNSSSGIKETPAFGCPVVNIGTRQEGRLRGENVLDTDYNIDEIFDAVQRCVADVKFRTVCKNVQNPYWMGGAGVKMANVLANLEIDEKFLRKKHDFKR